MYPLDYSKRHAWSRQMCQEHWLRPNLTQKRHPVDITTGRLPRIVRSHKALILWNDKNITPFSLTLRLLVSVNLAHSKFHRIPWNSMELLVSSKLAHSKFHGIPWNYSCQRNWRTWSSMEFHGTARVIEISALQVPWNSMELLVSVPWNSMEPIVCYLMEPLVSSIHWVLNWDRIPWNLSFQILIKIMFNCAGWINFRKLINTLHLFASLFHQLMFYY